MGRTLYDATVRLFDLRRVLGGLLCEHTPLLKGKASDISPRSTGFECTRCGIMYVPPGVPPDVLPSPLPEPSSCSPPFSPAFACESQSEIP